MFCRGALEFAPTPIPGGSGVARANITNYLNGAPFNVLTLSLVYNLSHDLWFILKILVPFLFFKFYINFHVHDDIPPIYIYDCPISEYAF